jgi:hypothetical protein
MLPCRTASPPSPVRPQTSLPTNAPRHTILLVQADRSPRSRTFYDFESKTAAMDGVVRLFEENLKNQHKAARTITYDVADLFAFIDSLGDISCLMCVGGGRRTRGGARGGDGVELVGKGWERRERR